VIELALVYCAILWVIFKKFKLLPVNTWTMVGSFLVGGFMLLFLLILMNMYQPITDDSRFMAPTTPIVAEVRGKVIEVAVKANTPLKSGDVLFKINPAPFQHKVTAIDAQLTLARTRLKQETDLVAQKAGNEYEVQRYDAEVKRLTSELEQAKIDLDNTTIRAPADGYAPQVALRPGQMVVPMPLAPVMVFVRSEERYFVAAFRQNSTQGIDPGDKVEVSMDAVPGRVFAGKVKQIIPMMAEGQASATGTLITLENVHDNPGRVLVQIEFTDDMSSYKLPVGASGTTAVYTGKAHLVQFVRMILLRTKAWEKYLFSS
jgi:RND family efflux transporter MFP subunit